MGSRIIWLCLAGCTGTLLRYWMQGFVQRFCGDAFPWGTLVVNTLGCFLFGIVWTLAEERLLISGETRLIALTGFMGAFTTFSTFAYETGEQLRQTQWLYAAGNISGQVGLGLLCVFLGFAVGRLF